MNRRNFLSMLSALPFVRGLSAPKPDPAILVEPPQESPRPAKGPPIEISINGQICRAKSLGMGGSIGAGQRIEIRGIDGWAIPLRRMLTSYAAVTLRLLKPEGPEWRGMLVSLEESRDEQGHAVTHVEFIADRREQGQ